VAATDAGSYEERECSRCYEGREYDARLGAWVECRTCSVSRQVVACVYPKPSRILKPTA